MSRPTTLTIDIGGKSLKASVLDAHGEMAVDPVRIPTTYPLSPSTLIERMAELASSLPAYDRIAAGFPGMVRDGIILTAPHFITKAGPGTAVVDELASAWSRFDLATILSERLGRPARVVNDADLHGAAVISGEGLELVITLGTGLGTGLYSRGALCPHLELAHHPFRKAETYDEQLGERARRRVGAKVWNRRVKRAVDTLSTRCSCTTGSM